MTDCSLCRDGYARKVARPGGPIFHEALGLTWWCADQATATDEEKRDELRNEIANSGDT